MTKEQKAIASAFKALAPDVTMREILFERGGLL